jgi:hypothetical protein
LAFREHATPSGTLVRPAVELARDLGGGILDHLTAGVVRNGFVEELVEDPLLVVRASQHQRHLDDEA